MTATQLAAAVRAGRARAADAVSGAVERCRADPFNAIQSIDPDAVEHAADVTGGRLAGVPVLVKDNLVQRGRPCTCGSRMLASYTGTYDATVVERLRAEGAVIVGRTHMDEFAMGSSSETCAWGAVQNPRDPDRVPGGSSGGSAAAVAAGLVPVALGSDTGGSVRQPAAFTGVVGLKPTYGRVSRRGLVAFASSTDQVGPLAANVRDCALVAEVIAGPDPGDATSLDAPVPNWLAACEIGIAGKVLGIPTLPDGVDSGVRTAFDAGVDSLRAAGARVIEVTLPSLELAVACYYVLAPAEASANLARFDGMRYGSRVPADTPDGVYRNTRSAGFGREVQRRILVGTYVLSAGYIDAYYRQALRVRAEIQRELSDTFERVDALLTPTAPTVAYGLGEVTDPLQMYLGDVFTIPASLAGLPALSVPCGTAHGLPVGLQVQAAHGDEATCFAVAAAIEGAFSD